MGDKTKTKLAGALSSSERQLEAAQHHQVAELEVPVKGVFHGFLFRSGVSMYSMQTGASHPKFS